MSLPVSANRNNNVLDREYHVVCRHVRGANASVASVTFSLLHFTLVLPRELPTEY